jgi:hypothetical protein
MEDLEWTLDMVKQPSVRVGGFFLCVCPSPCPLIHIQVRMPHQELACSRVPPVQPVVSCLPHRDPLCKVWDYSSINRGGVSLTQDLCVPYLRISRGRINLLNDVGALDTG